jgi:hypothetical protein
MRSMVDGFLWSPKNPSAALTGGPPPREIAGRI